MKEEITMYKIKVTANTKAENPNALSKEIKYSTNDIYNFLLSIDELGAYMITADEKNDGTCVFTIGDTTYSIMPDMI